MGIQDEGRRPAAPGIRVVEADFERADHADAIVDLIDAYARDPMGRGEGLGPDVKARLVEGLAAHPTANVFLAFEGTEPVGVAVCFLGFSTFAARWVLNVHDLAVAPEHRGRGIGGTLLEAVIAHAHRLGCRKVTLEVRADNEAARRLYRRLGFGPGGVEQSFWTRTLGD
ncbi:MAG: GNAT family N-acetyltransferase [Myxococcales bacterium]|nr:GNAT family N-acetyltransferase [Myxococcales bacterium]